MLSLDDVSSLADGVQFIPDDRPDWLRDMPSASHNLSLYYRFFHEMMKKYAPLKVIEIGTYLGSSAAHLAYANAGGNVITIDINPESKSLTDALKIPNLESVTSDSALAIPYLVSCGKFDMCFIDGAHNFKQMYREYFSYRDLVKDGGIIFFDDLDLKTEMNEMEAFWDTVLEPKRRIDVLHYTGFGVCQKVDSVQLPTPEETIKASEKYKGSREL